jgi:hypothetical protein
MVGPVMVKAAVSTVVNGKLTGLRMLLDGATMGGNKKYNDGGTTL